MTKFLSPIFLILVTLLTIFSYVFVDKNLSSLSLIYTGFSFNQRGITSAIFIMLVFLLFSVYFLITRYFYSNKINLNQIKKTLFLSCIILFFSYPTVGSYDIFNYTTTSKVLFEYRENPYIVMPIEFTNEKFLNYTHATNKTALYGPFWLILTGVPYLLSSWNFIIMLFSFKLLMAVFYFLSLLLIRKTTNNNLPVVFFGLNPLVLFETFVGGHNDIVMMFFVLLSFYLLAKSRFISSGLFLFLSFLIKFATIFLIPVYIYVFWLKFRKEKINWEKIYLLGTFFMSLIFFLSPIREEIYPWYFIWVLSLIALTKNIKLYILTGIFSFFLLLRYVPFMLLGSHFGITPYLKIGITFGPLFFIIGIFSYISLVAAKDRK